MTGFVAICSDDVIIIMPDMGVKSDFASIGGIRLRKVLVNLAPIFVFWVRVVDKEHGVLHMALHVIGHAVVKADRPLRSHVLLRSINPSGEYEPPAIRSRINIVLRATNTNATPAARKLQLFN